ncbi:MAG: hypothetical protein C0390_07340 [Syntrophus sp. (in: bacteria)]|nr:hypothetical protein [Syntrophus sp. (in: bacteria)]
MLGIGLAMMAVMFFSMFTAGGGPHHMADIHGARLQKTVQTDHGHGQISGGQQQATHGGHDHVGTYAGVGNEDKENQEP